MTFTIKNIWVLILFVLLGGVSFVLGSCGVTRTCDAYTTLNPYALVVFEPILLYSITTVPLALVLIFVRDDIFKQWFRFACWWIPLSILLIMIAPIGSNSSMPLYPDPTKENLALLMGALFTVISLARVFKAVRPHEATSQKRKLPREKASRSPEHSVDEKPKLHRPH